MSVIQIGNGTFNTQTWRYTQYDPNTGQLVTRSVGDPGMNVDHFVQKLQSGQITDLSPYFRNEQSNYLGGRSNVNVSRQVARAFDAIKAKYPQMDKDTISKYANQWVADRVSKGWDANEVENMMKDVTRADDSLNQDFLNGITGNISFDEYNATPGDATGDSLDPNAGRESIQDELREFAGHMMNTVGPDSPQAKRIAELAAAAGNKYATSSGMGPGGMTTQGVAGTAARAHTDLQTQREGLGLQALAAAGNQQLTVDQMQTQLQSQNQQANVMNASGIGGLIGSGLGLIGGVIGTAYSGGSMAPAIPGLMAAGGAAGQAVGGIAQNSGQPPIQYGGGQQAPRSTYKGKYNPGTS